MTENTYFMIIFFFSVYLLSNVVEGLSVNLITWCMIGEELQIKVLTPKIHWKYPKSFGVEKTKSPIDNIRNLKKYR